MPDITMCKNSTCPLRDKCYRATATPDTYQYYADFKHKDGKCDDFMLDLRQKTNNNTQL